MKRNRKDKIAGEPFALPAFAQNIAELPGKRYAVRVLQMMNDFSKCIGEEQCRSREIELMLTFAAESAQSFDRGRGLTALRTERRLERHEARPTLRTCPSPSALQNLSVTDDTRGWEQEVEDVVEQSAFGETQRAKRVYKTETWVSPQRHEDSNCFCVFVSSWWHSL